MEELIKTVTSNTLYLAGAIILGVIVLLAVMKKMIRLIILAFIVIAVYVGYLHSTGQKIPKTREETVKHLSEKFDRGREVLHKEMKNLETERPGR